MACSFAYFKCKTEVFLFIFDGSSLPSWFLPKVSEKIKDLNRDHLYDLF